MVIWDTRCIHNQPSHSLLLALMDLVDIVGGNGLDSVANVDKAGLKHVLLAHGNYMGLYVPNKDMISENGKRVIPVVTHYKENHSLVFYDVTRSMLGTYTVIIPTRCKGTLTLSKKCFLYLLGVHA